MDTFIIIGIFIAGLTLWSVLHQRHLQKKAQMIREAIGNRDFTIRLSTKGLLPGERALIQSLNQMEESMLEQINRNEIDSWNRMTRMLTHEMTNGISPIISISQTLLNRDDVENSPFKEGMQAIYDTSKHLSEFVINYRKISQIEQPSMNIICLDELIEQISKAYPQLTWEIEVPKRVMVLADFSMLRQVFSNLVKNAIEANARKIVITTNSSSTQDATPYETNRMVLQIGNDGKPIPEEDKQSLFVPFFTTKRNGNGIGLTVSRRMMTQQGGMLDIAKEVPPGYSTAFILTLKTETNVARSSSLH
ncbi:MAG: HAMP domain-containing histidine kinase [Prevotella sp.]|nr:HAMP domain-containing histidine kinase [Prevotella sp.]